KGVATDSSIDRGHLLPQSRRPILLDANKNPIQRTVAENEATFLLGANIHPQFHNFNAGAFRQHEKYCEAMIQAGWKSNGYFGVLFEGAHLPKLSDGPDALVVPSHTYRIEVFSHPSVDIRKATVDDLRSGRIKVTAFLGENRRGYTGDEHMAE